MPITATVSSRSVAGTKKIRGKPIALPKWWLDEVRERFVHLKSKKQITAVALAKQLSDAIGRELDWDNRAVERFLKGETTTFEMMRAFLLVWPSLVQPVFVAHSRRDAEQIFDHLRRDKSNPDWRNRYMELEEKLLEVGAEVLDQTPAVSSSNEVPDADRKPRGRRARGLD